jgi:DNA-binding beta-propeller fold protein YncE
LIHTRVLTVVNNSTLSVVTRIQLGGVYDSDMTITPGGKTPYFLEMQSRSDGAVIPINTSTNELETPIPVGMYPAASAMTPDGKTLYR